MFRLTGAVILSLAANALATTSGGLVGTEGTTLGPNVTLVGAANTDYISSRNRKPTSSVSGGVEMTQAAKLKPRMTAGPEYVTITIVNKHGSPISTSHYHNADSPSAVSGHVAAGTMAKGATAVFAVPTNWIGDVAIVDADYDIDDNVSLIEGNYVYADDYGYAIADFDVSYVNGFSVAITCWCAGTAVSGCNKNLWLYHTCGNKDSEADACINPTRNNGATAATAFFRPCAGAAFTYTTDYDADSSWGVCQGGHVRCCVGANCNKNPNQPSSNA